MSTTIHQQIQADQRDAANRGERYPLIRAPLPLPRRVRLPFNCYSVSADAKTRKGQARGWLTAIQYLLPNILGEQPYSVCPWARACIGPCLISSGRGNSPSVKIGRMRKTRRALGGTLRYGEINPQYALEMVGDVEALITFGNIYSYSVAVRNAGTDDLPWPLMVDFTEQKEKGAILYDYTKKPRIVSRRMYPSWWHLTYSIDEQPGSWTRALEYLKDGFSAAIVMSKPDAIRTLERGWFRGYPVSDGMADDLRFLDPPGSVCVLKAIGKAKKDTSGFVYTLTEDDLA